MLGVIHDLNPRMTSPRNAPRREVVEITKFGQYGSVVWAHLLECGHTSKRKRKAPGGFIGCTKCVEATGFEELASALATPVEDPLDDGLSESEAEAHKVRALLAGRFNVPPEQVDVVVRSNQSGEMALDSATISLTARQLRALR